MKHAPFLLRYQTNHALVISLNANAKVLAPKSNASREVVNNKGEDRTDLGHAEVIDSLLIAVIIRQSAQRTSLVSA
jgi:hypothetical protein